MIIPDPLSPRAQDVVKHKSLQFDKLVGYLKLQFMLFPDSRYGFNTKYSMLDAGLGAFSIFFMQSPSFLSHQKQLQENKGKNNANSLFQIEQIMSDCNVLSNIGPNSSFHLAVF